MIVLKDIFYFINKKIMGSNFIARIVLFVVPPNKYLFGKQYDQFYETINFKNGLRKDKLFLVANNVKVTTPYYNNIPQKEINSLDSFEKAFKPFNKDVMVECFESFLSTDFSPSYYELMTTGGTSGPASQFYVSKSRYKKEYAFYHKIWSTLGYDSHLRGVIRNEKLDKDKGYKINPITKEVIFDGFRNNDQYYESIYQTIVKFKIIYLQGYPSSIYNFFLYLNKADKDLSFLRGVFLSSEVFLEHQRKFLVQELKLPVISVYGHSEKLALAVDFKGDNLYTLIEDYGYVELIDEHNNAIKQEGLMGEIVVTTYDNLGMPLVRYKTGDYSSYYNYSEIESRILKGIQGRWNEMKIYNKDDSFITPTALNLHDELNKCVDGLQYIQNEKGVLHIHIVANQFYDHKVENALHKHFKERMASDAIITIEKVKSLKKRPNGKFLILESSL